MFNFLGLIIYDNFFVMTSLLQLLNSIHKLSDDLLEYLNQNLLSRNYERKELLLKKGQVCRNIFFIEQGLIRCFYMNGTKEVTSWFMKEGDVVISVESFFKQTPSYESMQALEDCVAYYLEYAKLQFIYRAFPEFNFIGRILTEKYYALCEQRLYSIKMQSALERYAYLMQNFPELIQRVSSTYLASYLGVRLETLSRIRNQRKLPHLS